MIRQIWLLARRDLVQRARSRAFVITLMLTVGTVIAIGPVLSLILGPAKPVVVGVTGPDTSAVTTAVEAAGAAAGLRFQLRAVTDEATGEGELRAGDLAVLVVTAANGNRTTLVWKDTVDATTQATVAGAVEQVARSRAAAQLGIPPADVARLVAPEPPASRTLAPVDPQRGARVVAATLVAILLYMAIAIFGQFVLTGVMEEKSSRVVEVVLSRARPAEVLAGKVLGIGLLGLAEMAALGAAAMISARTVDIPGVSLPPLGMTVVLPMLIWFVLGYTFYAVIYATMGSTVSRQEDAQGAAVLPSLLLLPGYLIGLAGAHEPANPWIRLASILPTWSPVVMPTRIATGSVAWWEVALAVTLLVLSSAALIWIGGRIYSGALLRIGRKVRLRDAWRSATVNGTGAAGGAAPAGGPGDAN